MKVHWVPLTTSSVITSTRIQRANNLVSGRHHLIDHNVKKFGYNEHPATTRPKRDPVYNNRNHTQVELPDKLVHECPAAKFVHSRKLSA